MEALLGTGEVARLCGVSEATIKRWADEGALDCVRTVGGHRRFRAGELRRFLISHGYALPTGLSVSEATEPDPEGVALYALNDEFERVVDRLSERAVMPGSEAPEAIFRSLVTVGIPLDVIYDRLVMPARQRLAALREEGKLGAVGLDVALGQIEDGLARVQTHAGRQARRGRLALVTRLALDPSDLDVRLAASLLEADGWSVASARAGASAAAVVDYLKVQRPGLLCITAREPDEPGVLREQLSLLHGACRETGSSMILLGRAVARMSPPPAADRVVADLPALLEASREL
jgi:excisionase family DNA binding protein